MKKLFLLICIILLFSASAYASLDEIGVPQSLLPENNPDFQETCRIKIINQRDGEIAVSRDLGKTWEKIGEVVIPALKVNDQGYTASKWIPNGEVCATAVNAIHIKAGYNEKNDRGIIFSILPKEFSSVPKNYNSFYSPSSSILTNIPAGTCIFGGEDSPFTGDKVIAVGRAWNPRDPKAVFVPKEGDQFIIYVIQPKVYPREIVFENRFGGFITLRYLDGKEKIIGQVLKPVLGVGRFSGTQYAEVGRIRANHSAVIDIATSPLGKVGGFQIIPAYHGMSPEMIYARAKTQWMIVGPPNIDDPSFEGAAPLFKYFIRPVYVESTLTEENWQEILLSKFLAEVKMKGKDTWQAMPPVVLDPKKPLPDYADRILKDVAEVRILFPQKLK
ncbi:MAG: hypothetical protein KKB81_06600 [Candidatus Margulisbacteria bacterium]|nr:hypothetical protein [Candidatus Margulisiibacteriota bacterium]MBU1022466.1 hypothetical protein [Candidatus Margulisiibacteriota bacterium]MBU1728450.1 hypothetical protein [Candidatus Margulisiibacteriota bacterium]MBU1954597.1 hypothetical protein [Candidatus Margulisiibacteriota bacterium]